MPDKHFKDLKVDYCCPLVVVIFCFRHLLIIYHLTFEYFPVLGNGCRRTLISHSAPHSSATKMWPVIALNAIMTLTHSPSRCLAACLPGLWSLCRDELLSTMRPTVARCLPVWQRAKGQGQLTRRCWVATGWRFLLSATDSGALRQHACCLQLFLL